MEDLQIMSESNQIEARVQQTNALKGEMVCQVAKLQEELHLRCQLQHRLLQLQFKLKTLKSQQCDLEQQGRDFDAQSTQFSRDILNQRAQIDHAKITIVHLDSEVTQKLQQIAMHRQKIRQDAQKRSQLSIRANCKAHLSKQNSAKLQTMGVEIQHSKQLVIRKEELISKLQSTIQYYAHQASQIKNQIHRKQADIHTVQRANQQIAEAIEAQREKQNKILTDVSLLKKDERRLVEEIEDQKTKNKLVKQKILILQNRAIDAEQVSLNYQNCVYKKREQAALKADRGQKIISNWLVNSHKWRIDLEYSRKYCNALSSPIN